MNAYVHTQTNKKHTHLHRREVIKGNNNNIKQSKQKSLWTINSNETFKDT